MVRLAARSVAQFSSGTMVPRVKNDIWNLGRLNHVAIAVPNLGSVFFYIKNRLLKIKK